MKRVFKCAVSAFVFAASSIAAFMLRIVRAKRPGSCVVLYYHSVPSEQRSLFARQLDTLLRHARPIRVDQRTALEPGSHAVGVTFDDGFENFSEIALPELTKRSIPSAVFIIVGALGKSFGPANHAESVMTPRQVQALPGELVAIGSHTVSHPFMPSLTESEARSEFVRSKQSVEALVGREVRIFSFPFGGFNEKLVELCRESGYERVFTTLPHLVRGRLDGFVVGRVRVDPTDWRIEFRLKLAGAYGWLPVAFRVKRMLLSNSVVLKLFGPRDASNCPNPAQSAIHEQSGQGQSQTIGSPAAVEDRRLPVS